MSYVEELRAFRKDQSFISEVSAFYRALIETHPILANVDLVIDAGSGGQLTMGKLMSRIYRHKVILPMDLIPMSRSARRLANQVDDDSLAAIVNEEYDILWANCFDHELIEDIKEKLRCSEPLLVSMDALYALQSREAVHGEKKIAQDRIAVADWFISSPYCAHLHLDINLTWLDRYLSNPIVSSRRAVFENVEGIAINSGWLAERLTVPTRTKKLENAGLISGLLLLNPKFTAG